MRRLVFIDDDESELVDFRPIVEGQYEYKPILWPKESDELLRLPAPDIFVSDLYLPPRTGGLDPTPAEREAGANMATTVSLQFSELYADSSQKDKPRLKATMKAILAGRDLLDHQWDALGQSPRHGIALLTDLKSRYPNVPFVFYSRKITAEDVIEVLQAGAVDAIRKGVPEKAVLERLANAQAIYRRGDLQEIKARGFNVNATIVSKTRS
jgi:DNA-binding NarL/FixJ family response regulator